MGIKIVEEPDICLTHSEYERLYREYTARTAFHLEPMSFETWVRQKKERKPITSLVQIQNPEPIPGIFGSWKKK